MRRARKIGGFRQSYTRPIFLPAAYPFHLVALWAIICVRYNLRTSVSNNAPSLLIRQPDSGADSLRQRGASSLGTNTKTADLSVLGAAAIQKSGLNGQI